MGYTSEHYMEQTKATRVDRFLVIAAIMVACFVAGMRMSHC